MIPATAKKSVSNAQKKLRSFTQIFAQCEKEIVAYGGCVASKEQIEKDQCKKEFEALSHCFKSTSKKHFK